MDRFRDLLDSLTGIYESSCVDEFARQHLVSLAIHRVVEHPQAAADLLRAYMVHHFSNSCPRGNSHAHPNGFDKLSLYRSKLGFCVRLHVWRSDTRHVEQIHSHRWDFSSVVLCGALVAMNYRISRADEHGGERYYAVRLGDMQEHGKRATNAGHVTLIHTNQARLGAMDSHSLRFSEPHRVRKEVVALTATLVVTAPACSANSISYRAEPMATAQVSCEPLGEAGFIDCVNILESALRN